MKEESGYTVWSEPETLTPNSPKVLIVGWALALTFLIGLIAIRLLIRY